MAGLVSTSSGAQAACAYLITTPGNPLTPAQQECANYLKEQRAKNSAAAGPSTMFAGFTADGVQGVDWVWKGDGKTVPYSKEFLKPRPAQQEVPSDGPFVIGGSKSGYTSTGSSAVLGPGTPSQETTSIQYGSGYIDTGDGYTDGNENSPFVIGGTAQTSASQFSGSRLPFDASTLAVLQKQDLRDGTTLAGDYMKANELRQVSLHKPQNAVDYMLNRPNFFTPEEVADYMKARPDVFTAADFAKIAKDMGTGAPIQNGGMTSYKGEYIWLFENAKHVRDVFTTAAADVANVASDSPAQQQASAISRDAPANNEKMPCNAAMAAVPTAERARTCMDRYGNRWAPHPMQWYVDNEGMDFPEWQQALIADYRARTNQPLGASSATTANVSTSSIAVAQNALGGAGQVRPSSGFTLGPAKPGELFAAGGDSFSSGWKNQ